MFLIKLGLFKEYNMQWFKQKKAALNQGLP